MSQSVTVEGHNAPRPILNFNEAHMPGKSRDIQDNCAHDKPHAHVSCRVSDKKALREFPETNNNSVNQLACDNERKGFDWHSQDRIWQNGVAISTGPFLRSKCYKILFSGFQLSFILPALLHIKNQPPLQRGDGPLVNL